MAHGFLAFHFHPAYYLAAFASCCSCRRPAHQVTLQSPTIYAQEYKNTTRKRKRPPETGRPRFAYLNFSYVLVYLFLGSRPS